MLNIQFDFPASVDAVRSQIVWNYVTLEPSKNGAFRKLQSPNYGNEHGMRTFNHWIINLPSTKDYMTIYVDDLRFHYMDNQNKTHCMPSYDFRINRGILTARKGYRPIG